MNTTGVLRAPELLRSRRLEQASGITVQRGNHRGVTAVFCPRWANGCIVASGAWLMLLVGRFSGNQRLCRQRARGVGQVREAPNG
jgi:hypothetical protein